MNYNTIITDLFWGDSGKGRVIDYMANDFDIIVRSQGGANAGHTIIVKGEKFILRHIPSGILHDNIKCVLAPGMVIDLNVLADEIKSLQDRGVTLKNKLVVSNKAHIIFSNHKESDDVTGKIGTTKKGIGPAYSSKVNRIGKRWDDIVKDHYFEFQNAIDIIKPFVMDTTYLIHTYLKMGNVLFEGAQGTLLDIDHGTYPYVTSSNTIAGGACTGAGVGPTMINEVLGITKAYVTRVGNGPFPTEFDDELAKDIRDVGKEYGSVTKRPRRIGWLDLPLLKYSIIVNGCTSLALIKLDVLSGLKKIKVCTSYKYNDIDTDIVPTNLDIAKPVYKTFTGWSEDISEARVYSDLPKAAQNYIDFLEEELNLDIILVSVGPERNSIIDRNN